MSTFKGFSELIERRVRLDGWLHQIEPEKYAELMKNEIDEVILAIKNGDRENLKEELTDILSMWATLAAMEHIPFEDIFKYSDEKINRRSPFIKENRKVSKEEALRLWMEAKAKEKSVKRSS